MSYAIRYEAAPVEPSAVEPGTGTIISHREFRNNSGAILRAVEAGESYIIANNGKPVAKLVPIDTPTDGLPLYRKPVGRFSLGDLAPHHFSRPSQEILDELREDSV